MLTGVHALVDAVLDGSPDRELAVALRDRLRASERVRVRARVAREAPGLVCVMVASAHGNGMMMIIIIIMIEPVQLHRRGQLPATCTSCTALESHRRLRPG